MNKTTYSWPDLPEEILELIGNRLENRIDVYRFRAICNSWRSVVPLSLHSSPHSPLIHLPPPYTTAATLSPVTVCRLEDDTRTAACLIKVTADMKIMSPLIPCSNVNSRDRNSRKRVNVASLRVVEVCRGYHLKFNRSLLHNLRFCTKVTLCETRGVFAIYDFGKLGYFGFDDAKNCTLLGTDGVKYEDIAVYNGQSYVVDSIGTVYWIDGKSMSLVQFSPPLFGLGQAKNLVVSDGDLFVVDSYFDEGDDNDEESLRPIIGFKTVSMRVYRLDAEWGTWVDVKSLGDRVFVLGKEVSFSVSSRDFPGCSRNCVYFADLKLEDRRVICRRVFGRVFDLEDQGKMKTADCFSSHRKLFSLPMNFPCTYESGSLGSLETLA